MGLTRWVGWVAVALAAAGAQAQRLPGDVRPEHYRLAITPDLGRATFRGTETIDVTLAEPARTITLNAIELEIQSVSANGQPGAVSFDEGRQQATFSFAQVLPAGHAAVEVAFTGVLNDKLRGFYLSKSKTRSYAVTQFESTDARRAFPCFDEPALKATFDVALTIDAGDTAISNTNIVSDEPAGFGKHTLRFATTPKMSTYLVAYLVGDFACSEGKAEGVPIRVCSTPDKVKLTEFALKGAEHFLKYYDRYFGIKYPMPKLDLIAIPDFEAGAMENFGAITYRETALLVDEKDSSINEKKRVSVTVAHEMAHQWFGDMVTMQWWDNLWLNEGFATWMETKASDDWHPEWNFPQDDADDRNDTLNDDAARTTRTIRAKAETPAEIAEMFDAIAYGKAGAVIGMVENWLGPKVFQKGVHDYLAAHLYGNATAEDFWNAQTAVSKQPVDKVMASFVDRPGVPLLTLGEAGGGQLPVAESRFYLNESAGAGAAGHAQGATGHAQVAAVQAQGAAWTIPVCFKTGSGSGAGPACRLLAEGRAEKDEMLMLPGKAPLLYVNAADKGYYRVAYTPGQLQAITAAVETKLSVTERMGFLGDRWALARAGQEPVGDFLNLVLAVKQDPNARVLDTALNAVEQIRSRIATDADRQKLNEVIRAQFGPVYRAMGPDSRNGSYDQQEIRTELYGALGEADDPEVLAHAREVAENLFAGKKTTEPDLVDVSVALAAAHGKEDFYDKMVYLSQRSDDPGLQSETQEMLTRFHEPILVIRTLEYAVSGQVRNQDAWILIGRELQQPETRDLAWEWVQQHWAKVQAQLTTASGADVVGATGSFCTVERREQVAEFFATHKVEAAERSLAKALDAIDACVRLRQNQEPKLKAWLEAQGR